MWVAVRVFVSRREEEAVREHARAADTGHQHAAAASRRPWRERLASAAALSGGAHTCRGDVQMLWKEIAAGFLIAGFVALLPADVFNAIFVSDAPPLLRALEN